MKCEDLFQSYSSLRFNSIVQQNKCQKNAADIALKFLK